LSLSAARDTLAATFQCVSRGDAVRVAASQYIAVSVTRAFPRRSDVGNEIVRQSHGHLTLESALGRGTRVEVFLPCVEGEAETAPAPSRQEPQAAAAGTVLVVEDEELVRRSLYDILEGQGYRVLQARNGREAMLIGRGYGGAIDLMLTDLVLPGLGGPELADELRPHRPDMRVLYISGYCGEARVRLEQAGKAFFPKPFTAAAIAGKVGRSWRRHSRRAKAP
jgi:CheY-like chemotaxis protein